MRTRQKYYEEASEVSVADEYQELEKREAKGLASVGRLWRYINQE